MRPNEVPDVPGASRGASPAARGLAAVIRGYQLAFSWLFAGSCRFTPSCSEYARLAVLGHGAPKGAWLALRRLLRCLPLGGYGFDPVPEGRAAVASTRRL